MRRNAKHRYVAVMASDIVNHSQVSIRILLRGGLHERRKVVTTEINQHDIRLAAVTEIIGSTVEIVVDLHATS